MRETQKVTGTSIKCMAGGPDQEALMRTPEYSGNTKEVWNPIKAETSLLFPAPRECDFLFETELSFVPTHDDLHRHTDWSPNYTGGDV